MAKASGKTRNSAPTRVQAVTERGLSEGLERALLGMENRIRRNSDESMFFYGPNGELLDWLQGWGAAVYAPESWVPPQNAVITHNHPRALGKTGIMAIGSFGGLFLTHPFPP